MNAIGVMKKQSGFDADNAGMIYSVPVKSTPVPPAILDRACVACHDGSKAGRPNFKDTTSVGVTDWSGTRYMQKSYLAFHPYVNRQGPEADPLNGYDQYERRIELADKYANAGVDWRKELADYASFLKGKGEIRPKDATATARRVYLPWQKVNNVGVRLVIED